MATAVPAPTFGHAAEAFILAHALRGAWSPGTAVKYRQTLAALARHLTPAGRDIAVLSTPDGAAALEEAFTTAFGTLAAATRARHLAAYRSALTWWAQTGWITTNPTSGRARPKITTDTTRALTRAQVDAIWQLRAHRPAWGLNETGLPYSLEFEDLEGRQHHHRSPGKHGSPEPRQIT